MSLPWVQILSVRPAQFQVVPNLALVNSKQNALGKRDMNLRWIKTKLRWQVSEYFAHNQNEKFCRTSNIWCFGNEHGLPEGLIITSLPITTKYWKHSAWGLYRRVRQINLNGNDSQIEKENISQKDIFTFAQYIFFLETENQGRRRYGTHFIASLDKGGFSGPKYQFKSKIHSAHFEINISSQFFKGQKFDFGEKWKWKKSEFTIVKYNSWAVQIQPQILHKLLIHWKKCDWNWMTSIWDTS